MLFVVLIICFIAIVTVALTFFYSKNTDKYGERLDGIENYPITQEMKDNFKTKLLENENVISVDYNVKGRIIYIHIDFTEKIKLNDAKTIVEKNIDIFGEDTIGYYDFNFIIKSENFTLYGAKNVAADAVNWNNNTEVKDDNNEKS